MLKIANAYKKSQIAQTAADALKKDYTVCGRTSLGRKFRQETGLLAEFDTACKSDIWVAVAEPRSGRWESYTLPSGTFTPVVSFRRLLKMLATLVR